MGNRQQHRLSSLFLVYAVSAAGQVPVLTVEPDQVIFRYRQEVGVTPIQKCVSVFTPAGPQAATASLTTDRGWAILPFSSTQPFRTPMNICVQARPQGLNEGTYTGQLKVSVAGSTPASVTIPVTMMVDGSPEPRLVVAPQDINVAVGPGAAAVRRTFTLMNAGGGSLSAPISPSTATWLSTRGGSDPLSAGQTATVVLQVDPTGKIPGSYLVRLVAQGPARQETVNVNLHITDAGVVLIPSQRALEFVATSGGAAPEAQAVGVVSSGPASPALSVDAQPSWLRASAGADSIVTVTANPSGLSPGRYAGQIRVSASGAANAPQLIAANLTVLPDGPLPVGSPPAAGIWLSPALNERTVVLNGAPDRSLDFTVLAGTDEGPIWLVGLPASGTIPAGGTLPLTVRANLGDLPAGTYRGTVRVGLSNGSIRSIPVVLQSGCPSSGWPGIGFLSPLQGFHATVGQAVSVRVAALGCDGTPLTDGDVGVMAGDQAIPMSREAAGVWAGTWIPSESSSAATLSALAGAPAWVDGQVGPTQADLGPMAGAAVSAASQELAAPVAAGSWMSIYGENMASDSQLATATPFPTTLGDVEVRFGDTPAPLYFVSPKQINLVVPRGLATSTLHSMVVHRQGTRSAPVLVGISDAAPAIFTTNQQGTGQAAARIAGTAVIPQKDTPARRGQYIELYCTGLGPVANPPADGDIASSTRLSPTVLPVTLSLGGRIIPVSFAGLVPGNVALYQVNFRIPDDGPLGNAVAVLVAVKSLVSNTATIAIQ